MTVQNRLALRRDSRHVVAIEEIVLLAAAAICAGEAAGEKQCDARRNNHGHHVSVRSYPVD